MHGYNFRNVLSIHKIKSDNNFFLYALTVALNYEKINDHPEKLSKIIPSLINTIGVK